MKVRIFLHFIFFFFFLIFFIIYLLYLTEYIFFNFLIKIII